MAYRGPTWVSTDDWKSLQKRQFEEAAKGVDLPSEPLRARNETDQFREIAKTLPLPSEQLRTQTETDAFHKAIGGTTLPSQEIAIPPETPPAASTQAAPSDAVGGVIPPAPADDPVAKTVAFLRGLVPGAGGGDGGDSAPAPGDTGPAPVVPASPDAQYAQPSAFTSLSQPDQLAAPAVPDPTSGPFTDDPVGWGSTAIEQGVGQVGGDVQQLGDLSLANIRAAHAGQDLPPAQAQHLTDLSSQYGLAMTPEPLANIGGKAAEAAGGLVDALGNPIRRAAEKVPILGPSEEVLKNVRVPKIAPDLAEKPIVPEATLPPHQVSPVRQLLDRSRNVIASMGDAGQELASRIHRWRDDAEVQAAGWIRDMPTVQKLSTNEMTNLVDVLERGRVGAAATAEPMNARVAQAATEAKGVLDDVYARAQNAGVDVGAKIEDYFPHRFSRQTIEDLRSGKRQREVTKHLLDTGQAATPDEAADVMHRFVTASRDRRQGSLEMERLANMPGYEKTKDALYSHLMETSRRIHEVAQFGPDDAIANKLLDRIGAEGHDISTARDLFRTIVGAKSYGELQTKFSGLIRQYNTVTRLGFAAIGNATQAMTNTAPVVGVVRTAMAYPKAIWSAADKDFALKAGATLDAVIKDVREGAGWSDKVSGVLMPGFNATEKLNRTVTAVAGRDFAIDMARKAQSGNGQALRALERLGLDAASVAKRGTLSEREQITAARSIVERTQFRVDPQDLPGWASSPWGKVVAQFRTFGYNQSAYVGREIVGEAVKGNVMPLIRFAIIGPLAGAAVAETRNALQARDPEADPVKRAAQYVMGPLGVVGDVGRAVLPINSDKLPVERQAAMVAGSVLGPSLGTLTELAGAGVNAERYLTDTKDHPRSSSARIYLTPAGRVALRQIPVVGAPLQNALLPYQAQAGSPYTLPGRVDTSRSSGRVDTSRKDARR